MSSYPHTIVVNGDGRKTLSIFLPNERPIVVTGDHPSFDRLLFEAQEGELSVEAFKMYILPVEEEE